jgi:hypothetical protein
MMIATFTRTQQAQLMGFTNPPLAILLARLPIEASLHGCNR